MFLPTSPSDQSYEPPFAIGIEHLDRSRDGHWRPQAFLKLTSTLRTSGFLAAIPPEELKTLFWVLSFLSANGDCYPTIGQLAHAMKLSETKARARMQRLVEWQWRERTMVIPLRLGNGLEAYALAPDAVPTQEADPIEEAKRGNAQPPIAAAPREAVIAYSRERYTRPRVEVEQGIEQQMGWDPPPEREGAEAEPPLAPASYASSASAAAISAPPINGASDEWRDLQRQLQNIGLNKDQANELMKRFDSLRIRRQLMWLPYRKVRNRVGFLVAAIEDDYQAPTATRRII